MASRFTAPISAMLGLHRVRSGFSEVGAQPQPRGRFPRDATTGPCGRLGVYRDGDLDRCNGMVYNGSYACFVTASYPGDGLLCRYARPQLQAPLRPSARLSRVYFYRSKAGWPISQAFFAGGCNTPDFCRCRAFLSFHQANPAAFCKKSAVAQRRPAL